jgi:hypothetical protein
MAEYLTYSGLIERFQSAKQKIASFNEIPSDMFNLKPDITSWSAAEICGHLTQFNRLYIREIQKAASNATKSENSPDQFSAGFFFRLYARNLEPPYKIKLKTLKPLYPLNKDLKKEDVIEKLIVTQSEILQLLSSFETENIDLDRTKGRNPLLKILPMSITDFLVLMDAHQRRHFWQLEQTILKLSDSSQTPD